MKNNRTNKLYVLFCLSLLTLAVFVSCSPEESAEVGSSPAEYNTESSDIGKNETSNHTTVTPNLSVSEPDRAYKSKLIDVPHISQKDLLPTGCEIISGIMLMDYYELNIDLDDFLSEIPISQLIETRKGLIGKSPNDAFIGDPADPNSFGCYAPVIVKAMNRLLPDSYKAENISGTSFEALVTDYIDNNIPVLVWASINMEPTSVRAQWTIEGTKEIFTWIKPEHCLVLVGYTESNYIFNDPYDSNGIVGYNKDIVHQRYSELGMQAVYINKD